MSRQLNASATRRVVRARRNPAVVALRMDIDEPQPSTSAATSSALAAPAAVPVTAAGGLSLSADDIPSDGEFLYDSDFGAVSEDEDDSDYDPANATLPDSTSDDDVDFDYVSQHDSSIDSIDSDEPLANVHLQRNAPGSKKWR